ncbi:MAG: hypothetical protein AAF211_19905, partial [Myxococcota bacterium]
HFGITGAGQLEGRSVPSLVDATAPPWSDARAQAVAEALRRLRTQRPAPARDDQVIVAWNALAISGLVRAYRALGEAPWLERALAAAEVLLAKADDPTHRLRRVPGGPAAMLEDESHAAVAALDLFGATGDARWLRIAQARLAVVERHYADPAGGWFRTPDDGEALLRRPKPRYAGAEPTGTATAIEAILRLAHLTDRSPARADDALRAYAEVLAEAPWAIPGVAAQVARRHAPASEIVVVWPDDADPDELLAVLGRHDLALAEVVTGPVSHLTQATDVVWLDGKVPRDGRPTAYVCRDGTCRFPVTEPGPFDDALKAQRDSIDSENGPKSASE